jgi:peptidoglycan/xylan/chitin deacetylase (PgdA/CDA1 family)
MTSRALFASIALFLLTLVPSFGAEQDLRPSATVLCYHIVESPADPRMEVSRDTFRQQMRYLAMTGYSVISLRDLHDYVVGKRASIPHNSVVVTIDDGWRSTYTEVFPEMKARHFPFTVFIYPKIIGQTANAMTWKQVKEMSDAGVDIQSHSLSHPFLTQRRHSSLAEADYQQWLQTELSESKRVLEHETGRSVSFLAYPYGDYDSHVAASAAKAGYTAALTCDYGRVKRGSDPLRMKRVIIEKKMDFAAFRHYLGAGPMRIEGTTPEPGKTLDTDDAVVTARIVDFKSIDPRSVGMALLGLGMQPFSYDPASGSVSLVVRSLHDLKGRYQRALIWGTDKSGRRVEASWAFKLPGPTPVFVPPIAPQPCVTDQPCAEPVDGPITLPAAAAAVAPGTTPQPPLPSGSPNTLPAPTPVAPTGGTNAMSNSNRGASHAAHQKR